MEEVVMTEMRTPKLSGKSPSGEANKLKQALLYEIQERKLPFHVIIGMFPGVQNSNFQQDAGPETNVVANTQPNLLNKF